MSGFVKVWGSEASDREQNTIRKPYSDYDITTKQALATATELVDTIGRLQNLDNELAMAKAQIEKMKCCGNCANEYDCMSGRREGDRCLSNRDKGESPSQWELRTN